MPPRGSDDMHPLLKERLHRPRTLFAPGARLRMNAVPVFLNLFIPWGVFTLCCRLTSFWIMYHEAQFAYSVIMLIFVVWLALLYVALFARRHSPEPTWFTYVALAFGVAAASGTAAGRANYNAFTRPYYEIQDLKVVHQLDASQELGQNHMDAGIIHFAKSNRLDATRSWHFKHRTLYCVAPIVAGGGAPLTQSYDFWAVGEDCCSTTSSDFRCGADWKSATTRSGLRVMDQNALMYYRLAAEQAETLYGIVAAHPIFITWTQDPLAEVKSWSDHAFKNYIFMVALAFVVSLLCLVLASCKYAWIGRAHSAYEADFYDDPDWKHAGESKPAEQRTRSYAAA